MLELEEDVHCRGEYHYILAFYTGYWAPEYLLQMVGLRWHVGDEFGAFAFL